MQHPISNVVDMVHTEFSPEGTGPVLSCSRADLIEHWSGPVSERHRPSTRSRPGSYFLSLLAINRRVNLTDGQHI